MKLCKNTLFENEDFVLEGQEHEGALLLHCRVIDWKLSTLKKMYSVFADVVSKNDKVMTITPNPKFAKLFGGRVIKTFEEGGVEYEVILWDTK